MDVQIISNFSGGDAGAGGAGARAGFGRPMQRARPGSTDCPGAGMQRARGCSVWGADRVQDSNPKLHYM